MNVIIDIIDKADIRISNKNSANSVGSGEFPHVTEGAELYATAPEPHTTQHLKPNT